ncbi:uncharacterized protein LOC130693910 [Daphnia carinata]|uniref:uncharacterized protein LOC130693910 n=1 Tax=Daphnia carinata TaxID=120202 RepID=UPI00258061B4|nr:uncharacterized protein LOC130693910 [Daphnia carinata]
MHFVMGPLILLAILACDCVMSEEFLRIELNDRLKQRYTNDSDDTRLEMDQEKQPVRKIGESSSHDRLNVIPTDLSERAFQKYYELRHRLKFRKLDNGRKEKEALPVESTSVPITTTERLTTSTTTKTNEEVAATFPLHEKQELPQEEELDPQLMTGTIDDYDIIMFVDKEQLEQEPIFSPSGVGFFHGIINFVRWLISQSADVEMEDYED